MATPSSIQELLQASYSFVRGVEANRATAALTLDHLIQQQIDAIQGGASRALLGASGNTIDVRMSKLSMLDTISQGIDRVVQAVSDAGSDPTKLEALGLNPEKVG
jgi:hypothetical protein